MIDDLTVCITNFKRANYLARAIKSVRDAGISSIVVASMEPDEAVLKIKESNPDIKWAITDHDGGCNSLWIMAAYHSQAKRVIILHDDDLLSPDLGKVYLEEIKPLLDSGKASFCSWRAHLMFDDGNIKPTEWFHGETRCTSSGHLRDFLLRPGRLSLSPIVSILDRDTLIGSLKEAHKYLTPHEECLYHQGMLLGTEIIVYLRHCAKFGKWVYINKVLSYYGACDSSGTVRAQKTGDLSELTRGYDVARKHFSGGGYIGVVHDPKIIFVYDDVQPKSDDEKRRFDYAMFTWKFHFNQFDVLEFPTTVKQWIRSSADMGDTSPVPYVKDLIDYGMSFAMPEDIVVYANRDICLTTHAAERIIQAVQKNGVAVAWRRNFIPKPGRLYKHSTMAKRDGGMDLVGISHRWWAENRDSMPDMFIGREAWDWCFRLIAEQKHGKSIYVDDIIYHEPHSSWWKQVKKTNPGQLHNRALAKVFFARRRDRRALMSLA